MECRETDPLPPLAPAVRELVETLWAHSAPLTTRQLHDATKRRYPHRKGRKLNSTSTLLDDLAKAGWVVGDKRGGGRWKWRAAVSRPEGMQRLAAIAVEEFSREPWDGCYLVQEAVVAGGLLELARRALGPAGAARFQSAGAAPAAGSNRSRGSRGAK